LRVAFRPPLKLEFLDSKITSDAIGKGAKLVFIDTPCNPILRLTDIAAVCDIAHAAGCRVVVDNTFASPIGCSPLALGADYVMHSVTKYIGGHGDAMGGSISGRRDLIRALISEATVHYGGVMSPFNAWLIARGATTLPLRMRAHQETALAVANALENNPRIERVIYPGLDSHPQRELVKRQMRNTSAMMTFRLKGGLNINQPMADQIAKNLSMVHYAVSLGHQRSLVCWMPTASLLETSFKTDATGDARYRDWAGDGIFRLSVGLEDPEDIISDLFQAMNI